MNKLFKMPIGQRLSPILEEIEDTLWEADIRKQGPHHFTEEGFRAAIKIFMSALTDSAYKINKNADGEAIGSSLRLLVKQYTGIDTHQLYKDTKEVE